MQMLRNIILAVGLAGLFAVGACAAKTPADKTTPEAPKGTDPCNEAKDNPCAEAGDNPCAADVEKAGPSIRGTDPCNEK